MVELLPTLLLHLAQGYSSDERSGGNARGNTTCFQSLLLIHRQLQPVHSRDSSPIAMQV
jgi:hypothetical protein